MKEQDKNNQEDKPKRKRKDYRSRKDVKTKLRNWQHEDWEELGSDYLEGDTNARDDK